MFGLLLFRIAEHWPVRVVKYGIGSLQNEYNPFIAHPYALFCVIPKHVFSHSEKPDCSLAYSMEVIC
jgi:hypothetical protein